MVKPGRSLSLRRWSAYVGLALGAMILAITLLYWMFGGAILNSYGKRKAERVFAEAHPGSVLRIGKLDYAVGGNRLVAQSVTLTSTNTTLRVGRTSLTGVRWARLFWGTTTLADALALASLEATNLAVEFPQGAYGIRFARVRASVPGSELIAEGTELRPMVGDEAFFAAHNFRVTRYHAVAPECRVLGLAYHELLQGKSFRARSIHFTRPFFDALVNRDKPPPPFVERPLMVHEALAAIRKPFQVASLSISNGHATYRERVVAGADPGVLTFGAISLSVAGVANHAKPAATIVLHAQGELMDAGTIKLRMSIPITPPNFSLHYSGTLSAMDLTRLSAFLDIAEHTRIKSGTASEAAFEIDVTAGEARGRVRAIYQDLKLSILDKRTGTEKGIDNRVASFLTNVLQIRNSNAPDKSGLLKEGKVNYTRRPEDKFLPFVWYALRSGVLDIISH